MAYKHNYPMNTHKQLVAYINSTFILNKKCVELKENTYIRDLCTGGILGVLNVKFNVKRRERNNVIIAFKQWYKQEKNKQKKIIIHL